MNMLSEAKRVFYMSWWLTFLKKRFQLQDFDFTSGVHQRLKPNPQSYDLVFRAISGIFGAVLWLFTTSVRPAVSSSRLAKLEFSAVCAKRLPYEEAHLQCLQKCCTEGLKCQKRN